MCDGPSTVSDGRAGPSALERETAEESYVYVGTDDQPYDETWFQKGLFGSYFSSVDRPCFVWWMQIIQKELCSLFIKLAESNCAEGSVLVHVLLGTRFKKAWLIVQNCAYTNHVFAPMRPMTRK